MTKYQLSRIMLMSASDPFASKHRSDRGVGLNFPAAKICAEKIRFLLKVVAETAFFNFHLQEVVWNSSLFVHIGANKSQNKIHGCIIFLVVLFVVWHLEKKSNASRHFFLLHRHVQHRHRRRLITLKTRQEQEVIVVLFDRVEIGKVKNSIARH